jgi:hypothetical protein
MNNFLEYYQDVVDWRDRIVTHRTPKTGKLTRVKIRSLPAEEQKRYAPKRIKDKIDVKTPNVKHITELKSFDCYVAVDDVEKLNELQAGELILATTETKYVMEYFDKEVNIVKLSNVPFKAVKSYIVTDIESFDFSEDFEVENIKDDEDESKILEIVNFSDYKIFLLDISPYMDVITIDVDTPDSNEDDFEELKESFSIYENLKTKLIMEDDYEL